MVHLTNMSAFVAGGSNASTFETLNALKLQVLKLLDGQQVYILLHLAQ